MDSSSVSSRSSIGVSDDDEEGHGGNAKRTKNFIKDEPNQKKDNNCEDNESKQSSSAAKSKARSRSRSRSCSDEYLDDANTVKNFPPKNSWPYLPIYIKAASDTKCYGLTDNSVPIGVPVDFETSLFKGKILIRVRNIPKQTTSAGVRGSKTSSGGKNQFYFEDYFKNRKRMRQYIIQASSEHAYFYIVLKKDW